MNDNPMSNPQNPLDELPDRIRQAVVELRMSIPPSESLERFIQNASLLEQVRTLPRRRRWISYSVFSALAAAVVVAATVLLSTPRNSWALVMEAVQMKPWIRGTSRFLDGKPRETWLSIPRDVSGIRDSDLVIFDDARAKTRYEFRAGDGPKGILYREPMPGQELFNEMKSMFVGAIQGDEAIKPQSQWGEFISQERRTVIERDKKWIDYDFVYRNVNRDEKVQRVLRVDPATNLPVSMKISSLSDGPTPSWEIAFDYPDENTGPRDIYDLGVPRDAQLVDRMPTRQLSDLISAIDCSQDKFGPYFAVVVHTFGNMQPWQANQVELVWRKGKKIRTEKVLIHPVKENAEPAEGADIIGWWKDRLNHANNALVTPGRVCDGSIIWKPKRQDDLTKQKSTWKWKAWSSVHAGSFNPWLNCISAETLPDVISYGFPPRTSGDREVKFLENPPNGPPGCILAEVQLTPEHAGAYHLMRYWYDPNHSYLMRKYELSDSRPANNDADSTDAYVSESIAKSPTGVWYSTCIRRVVTPNQQSNLPPPRDRFVWYYVDFNAKLPDSLFQPKERTGDIE